MNGLSEVPPEVAEFLSALSFRARENCSGQVAHAHLLAALRRGWEPKHIAHECSRDLPSKDSYLVIQRRLAWLSRNDPPGSGARPAGRVASPGGCEHTDDPNGWLMADDGTLTGRCACWAGAS